MAWAGWAEWKARESTKISSAETESNVEVGPPKLTRFERARIVGARALQIAMGAPILIDPKTQLANTIDIALEELKGNLLPITIRRTLPNGTYQDIPLKWLLPKTS
ncbi:MAG TPA: DNA-directed RNA polymerase subunit K [Candidatus Bathyarchaeia archaeon]|nr:DNA-directed RNA polymerase subunit K [Candidatus Bathyarchaeia archaeon]